MSLVLGSTCASRATPPPLAVPASSDLDNPNSGAGNSIFLGDLQRSNYLLGDLFGLRTELAKYGISLAIQETSEVLGNPTGGSRHGVAYDGLTQAIVQLDTQRAFGWYGGLVNISALQLHGQNLSQDSLLVLQAAGGIEGDPGTRLWEAWYDQKFLAEDRLDIRVGEQSIDQEFMLNPNGAYFLNSAFGWPIVSALDLPGGGPAAPLAALAVRTRYRPVDALNVLFGVFSGNPAPGTHGDPQLLNPAGISFPTNGGVLLIAELQYFFPSIGSLVEPEDDTSLGYTYRLGAWYNSGRFADQRLDTTGSSLASPLGNGMPLQHRGDYAVYAVADRMVWQNDDHPNRNVSVFGRAVVTPQTDRNLVDVSVTAGLVYHSPIISRPDDTVAAGMGYVHVSRQAAALDRDTTSYGPPGFYYPIRRSETCLEATYQAQVYPWWQLQPDLQYVFSPGGGVANPSDTTRRIKDELILALRTNILF
jgi:porin